MVDKVHAAVVRYDLSDDYNRHTGAMMASVMENCSKPVVFHILHEEKISFKNRELSNENIDRYNELVDKYGCELYIHNVDLPDWINEDNIPRLKGSFIPTGLYRFYLPTLLPDLKYVVSLGSDVIVKTDLAKLIDTIPDDVSLIGARTTLKYINNFRNRPSMHEKKLIRHFDSININIENYVNADVLIFNLDKIRLNKTLPDYALNYLQNHKNVEELEQEIFNIIFKDDIFYIDPKYNITVGSIECYDESIIFENGKYKLPKDCILHYCNRPKPWDCYLNNIDFEYWHYLSLTPWGHDNEMLKNYLSNALNSPYETINNIDKWIWTYQLKDKIKELYKLTFPLYIKILKRYI